jgi:hypothetical protein
VRSVATDPLLLPSWVFWRLASKALSLSQSIRVRREPMGGGPCLHGGLKTQAAAFQRLLLQLPGVIAANRAVGVANATAWDQVCSLPVGPEKKWREGC